MNTNLIHNILNLLIVVLSALAAFDWSGLFAPHIAAMIVSAIGFLKMAINFFRDGATGMVKPQPPVTK